MIRNTAYIAAGKRKIQKAPAYGLSMPELEHYLTSVTDNETFIKTLINIFYLGVEAGYRIKNKEK